MRQPALTVCAREPPADLGCRERVVLRMHVCCALCRVVGVHGAQQVGFSCAQATHTRTECAGKAFGLAACVSQLLFQLMSHLVCCLLHAV